MHACAKPCMQRMPGLVEIVSVTCLICSGHAGHRPSGRCRPIPIRIICRSKGVRPEDSLGTSHKASSTTSRGSRGPRRRSRLLISAHLQQILVLTVAWPSAHNRRIYDRQVLPDATVISLYNSENKFHKKLHCDKCCHRVLSKFSQCCLSIPQAASG